MEQKSDINCIACLARMENSRFLSYACIFLTEAIRKTLALPAFV